MLNGSFSKYNISIMFSPENATVSREVNSKPNTYLVSKLVSFITTYVLVIASC